MNIKNFNGNEVIIETTQGTFVIKETDNNVECEAVHNKEEVVSLRLNRVSEKTKYRIGDMKATNECCNPYVMVWLNNSYIQKDMVTGEVVKKEFGGQEE